MGPTPRNGPASLGAAVCLSARSDAASPIGAFQLAFGLRVEQQLRQRRDPTVPDRLDVATLAPAERRHLTDALRGIRDVQTSIGRRYGLDQLG